MRGVVSQARPGPLPAVRLERETGWAWCGERRLELTPRVFAVLRYLVEHPERLVAKDDLLGAVWRDVTVSDAALTSCIRDLRRALGDSSQTPRYIQTVHRRGFRFIGPVERGQRSNPPSAADTAVQRSESVSTLVGRDSELGLLRDRWTRARAQRRQVVFVTGEPGIGKTALVEAFLAEMHDGRTPLLARGQCVEQYGASEAYLPLLEALGRLGRDGGRKALVEILRQYAPTWLLQLPALLNDLDLEAVQRRAHGASRDRMLRELVEAIDAISRETPLVLVLEDLHWSDSATIDLLGMLARRRDPAALLVLGTYRPADVAGRAHPLKSMKQELQLHGHCEEMLLEFLSVAAVGEYLARRFSGSRLPPDLAVALHRSTDGNPLFVVNTIDALIAHGQLRGLNGRWDLVVPVEEIARRRPETLAQMVHGHVERLTAEEQALLQVASVAGAEFSAALAAAGGIATPNAERLCEGLARRGHFLRAAGLVEWPDGTVAGRYAFIHALYRHVLYERVSVAERVGLHLRIGDLLERAHGREAGDIAGELAMHFEHGRDVDRAVRYRRHAGEQAIRRHGYREAAEHAARALESLEPQPDSRERIEQELALQVMLGSALTALKGHAAPEVEAAYARARALCERGGDSPRLFPVLVALGWFYLMRGPAAAARDVGTRLAAMADAAGDPAVRLGAHTALGLVSFYLGDFEAALDHSTRGRALYDPATHSSAHSPAFRGNVDPGVSCTGHAAWALWVLGYPAQAAARMQDALALAHSIAHPFTLAQSCRFGAAFHLSRRERDAVRSQTDVSLAVAAEHGFGAVIKAASFHKGWILADQGGCETGLDAMHEWLTVCRDIRASILIPAYQAWLAEIYGTLGRPAEGRALVDDALAAEHDSGYRYWSAELHRLKGTLILQDDPRSRKRAESCFRLALEIATQQRAKLFELRAAMSLGRLWAKAGRRKEAHALLADVYGWFSEGFETPDLIEAKALLEDLQ